MLALRPLLPFFPTASELRVASECVFPWALGLPMEQSDTEAMRRGRERHLYAEKIATVQPVCETDGAWAPALRELIYADAGARKSAEGWYVEQGVRWSIGFRGDEAELIDRSPGERLRGAFCGTADLAYVDKNGILVVVDWKFGEAPHLHNAAARENPQLWFLALALTSALKISGGSSSTVVARVELRSIRDDGQADIDSHELTQGDLDRFATVLADLADRIVAAQDARPTLSQACGSCRSRASCSAWSDLEVAIARDLSGASLLRPPETPGDMAFLRHAIVAGKATIEKWEEWRKAYHLYHPEGVPVGLGLVERLIPLRRSQVIKTPEAYAAIREHAGEEAVEMRPHATMESIRKAARDQVGGETRSATDRKKLKDKAEDEVLQKLRGVGAIQEAGESYKLAICRSDGSEVEVVDNGSY